MEKTATQRMVGFLVIVALVIIILPLFSEKKEPVVVQQVAAKAPEFPDQTVKQSTSATASLAALNDKAIIIPLIKQPTLPALTPATSLSEQKKIAVKAGQIPTKDVKAAPVQAPTQTVAVPPVAQPPKPDAADITPAIANDVNTSVESQVASDQDKTISHLSDTGDKISLKTHGKDKAATQLKSSMAKLSQPAWAIQMGNFKEKENATRLVDQLRSAGYKAFTREIKSSTGAGTRIRVYIGPEFKQAYAIALSNKIQAELKLRGLVVTYKPLEL